MARLCCLVTILLWVALPVSGQVHRPNLTGVVVNEQGDSPIDGATVFIYTAGVRTGTSPFCPSCYADCAKKSKTEPDGRFSIESLDPALIFKTLTVAEGFEPGFSTKIDPAKGPIEVKLKRIDSKRLGAGHVIRGRVLDEEGHPVVGATVIPRAFRNPNTGSVVFGVSDEIDPIAVTNIHGEFTLTGATPGFVLDVKVEARGLATALFNEIAAGEKTHELRLNSGATIVGRLMQSGEPVAGAAIGLVQKSRASEFFIGDYTIGTNEKGYFELSNVAPNDVYYIYGKMESLRERGAVPAVEVQVSGHGSEVDVGVLEVVKGHRLKGRIELSDGKPVPEQTRLLISRDDAWDSILVALNERGEFDVANIPTGIIGLSARIKGYCPSLKNRNLDLVNPFGLLGTIHRDTTDFVMLFEPGDRVEVPREMLTFESFNALKQSPIRGVEESQ